MANTYTVNGPAIEKSFTYHAPNPKQVLQYEKLREEAKKLAYIIAATCPDSREKSLAMTKLEEAIMFANKAVAHEE
jgi:hypothetical protein